MATSDGGIVKLVLFSDLHLDSQFAWLGTTQAAARKRRQALRDTLKKIVTLAQEERADAVLCAGDLYEHERVSEDTGQFLRATFADLHPIRVFLAPGNHDWFGPNSLYHRVEWSPNVHVFREAALKPVELVDGVTLWGAAHRAPANTDGFLERFRVERNGVNLALFHGSMQGQFTAMEEGKVPHAPFTREQVPQAGLHHAFVGHFHRPSTSEWHTYPGNPDPLTFGEDLERGAVVATIGGDGAVTCQTHAVNVTQAHDLDLDVTGCPSAQDVRDLLATRLAGLAGVARVTLRGELRPQVELRLADLHGVRHDLDGLVVRTGNLRSAYDLDSIAKEATVRGQFVRDVLDAELDEEDRRRVLLVGLRALEGRGDLEPL
jgi:DNA repair protein SbcD/Mre11